MIKGQKIILKILDRDDLDFAMELFNDEEVSLVEGRWGFPLSRIHQEKWLENNYSNQLNKQFVIVDKNTYEKVGYTSLNEINWQARWAHMAVKLHPKATGKGYAYDAGMTLFSYAFYQMGLNKLKGMIAEWNLAPYNLYMNKMGWKVEGIYRQHHYVNGRYYDSYALSLLRSEFLEVAKGTPYEKKDMIELFGKIDVKDEHIVFNRKK